MRILITAGPTREPIDPVRFLSNRSSGRMGFALAERAVRRGHRPVLISGPVALDPPEGLARLITVNTTAEMLLAVNAQLPDCEVLVMAAAPADWRPLEPHATKLKKSDRDLVLRLTPNPDILRSMERFKPGRIFVGFAAESGDPTAEGRRKRRSKSLDLVVANDISAADAGFEVSRNRVVLIDREGSTPLPLMDKHEVADKILERIERMAAE